MRNKYEGRLGSCKKESFGSIKKEDDVLKADISKQIQQTAGDSRREERKSEQGIKETKAVKKRAVDSTAKVATTYDAKLHEINEKLKQ